MARSLSKKMVWLVLLFIAFALQQNLSPAAEKMKLGTSVRENPLYVLPPLAAEEKGFWKEQGIQVDYIPFRGGSEMHRAAAAGALDMGISGAVSIVQAVTRGLPEIIVAQIAPEEYYFWVRADSPIKGPKDVRGVKMGVNRFGGLAHAYGRAVAKALKAEKEIKFVAGGGQREEMAAIRARTLDGRFSSAPTMAPLKWAGMVREVISVSDYLPKKWVDLVLWSRIEVVVNRPPAGRAATRGILKGKELIAADPAWAIGKMKSNFGFSEELARFVYPMLRYYPQAHVDLEALENVRNFLVQFGIVSKEKVFPMESLYTGEFLF